MSEIVLEVGIGSGILKLTEEEAKMLAGLYKSPYWPFMEKILIGIQEASQVALRDTGATENQLRVEQGRIQAVQLVAEIVVDEVGGWYERQATTRSDTA